MAAQQMVTQALNPISRGKIVIISSVQSEVAATESVAYNMSKAAINHMARTMAAELVGKRININVILPGWIDTPGERSFYTEEELQEGGRLLPWGRLGTPDDIANGSRSWSATKPITSPEPNSASTAATWSPATRSISHGSMFQA